MYMLITTRHLNKRGVYNYSTYRMTRVVDEAGSYVVSPLVLVFL